MNYPHGLSRKDMDYIEGRHYEGESEADRDELRGQDWMRSLPVKEHAAIPVAMNPAGTRFRAMCRCRWEGPVWAEPFAKSHAQLDANAHNQEHS